MLTIIASCLRSACDRLIRRPLFIWRFPTSLSEQMQKKTLDVSQGFRQKGKITHQYPQKILG
jgi:hypothetical protein